MSVVASNVVVEVFAAACNGSARLSEEIGLPLVHVDVAPDAERAIRRLNTLDYGGGVRVPDLFQPIGFDPGWSTWRLFEYAPGAWRRGMGVRPRGVVIGDGRMRVSLPPDVVVEFREELQAALRHLRLHEVTSEMAYMQARNDACLEYVVEPRYTQHPETRDFRGARRVDDLYVLDPAEAPWRLFWTVVAARLAVIGEARP